MRLSGAAQFSAVHSAKVRVSAGPLTIHGLPNGLTHPRLGLAISRRFGNAVQRNTIKRRLREAFRHLQHEWPPGQAGYDLVISARRHILLSVSEYQAALRKGMSALHAIWSRKLDQQNTLPAPRPLPAPPSPAEPKPLRKTE